MSNENNLDFVELYPKIFVYKNMFKDVDKVYSVLKESAENKEDRILEKWVPWSRFGDYLPEAILNKLKHGPDTIENINKIKTETSIQEDQKQFILELLDIFNQTTRHYAEKNDLDFDLNEKIVSKYGKEEFLWEQRGPQIARYRQDMEGPVAMNYHSDYIREPIIKPAHKFVVTVLAYFNDDYENGEIDFCIGKDLYKYKPEAGDIVIFPSGHPDILTKDGDVYLHGVMPAKGPNKYLCRMYLAKYEHGDDEWYEKENEFGADVWKEMQTDIMEYYNANVAIQRHYIEGNRIK
jgi:hypothetical protein